MTAKSRRPSESKDEISELILYLQKHPTDEHAQEKVVLAYEKLVHSLARKYSRNSDIHEDLVQVGMIGLLGAIRRFDPSYGRSFETFAIPTILGEIKRFIRDKTWSVHVPRRIKELGPKIKKAADQLTSINQKSPTIREIADYLDVTEEEVLETMEMGRSYRALSADRKIEADSDGGSVSVMDLIGTRDHSYHKMDSKILLESIMPILSDREQKILQCTFFENKSQKETGELLGISQMHVSRLQRQSLRKLNEFIQSESSEVLD